MLVCMHIYIYICMYRYNTLRMKCTKQTASKRVSKISDVALLSRRCSIRVLGVTIDQYSTSDNHVNKFVQSYIYRKRGLHHIRQLIDKDMVNTLSCSIVGCRLDYCNARLYGMTQTTSIDCKEYRTLSPDLCVMQYIVVHPSHYSNPYIGCQSSNVFRTNS